MLSAKKILLGLAAASLAVTPAMAQTQLLKKATVERSVKKSKDESEFAGVPVFILVLSAAAIITGIIVVADDEPSSP